MRWFVAGLAFAAFVGLAVATASLRSHNVHARASIQRLTERLEAVHVQLAAERVRFAEATRPDELLRHWRRLEREMGQRSGA
jgi:hypothetical protein